MATVIRRRRLSTTTLFTRRGASTRVRTLTTSLTTTTRDKPAVPSNVADGALPGQPRYPTSWPDMACKQSGPWLADRRAGVLRVRWGVAWTER